MGKKEFREQLRQPDEFSTFFGTLAKQIADSRTKVLIGAILTLVAVGVVFAGLDWHERKKVKAADRLFAILETVTKPAWEASSPEETLKNWKEVQVKLSEFEKEHKVGGFPAVASLFEGRALVVQGKHQSALEVFQRAAQRLSGPYRYLAKEGQALALMELKKWDEAEAIWEQLIKAEDNPLVDRHLWNLGLTQEGAQRKDEAVGTYSQLKKDFPDSPLLEKVRVRLDVLESGKNPS